MNAQNEELYNELSQPKIDNAYKEMLDFAKKCVQQNIKTTLTVVTNFKNYKIDEAKKKQLTRQATLWKKRKLLELARQILSEAEYQTFSETIYPTNGQADAFKRNQALKAFQEKVKQKKQQDAASAKTLY